MSCRDNYIQRSIINPTNHKRSGFNLVEAAIVLGIVGLVIGGVWIAAASVNSRVVRNDIVSRVSIAISTMQHDFKGMPPVSSGQAGLNDYALRKGLLNYPYSVPSQPWLGLKTPDGGNLQITYYAPGGTYSGQSNAITVSFGGIEPEDCYAYLNNFSGYSGVINGHGDYATIADLKASVDGKGAYFFCDAHLTNQISLIFPL